MTEVKIIILITSYFIVFLVSRLVSPYLSEKGKNIAAKEDSKRLTNLNESVKYQYATEARVAELRRHVYENMCIALQLFISGHEASGEQQKLFHAAYAKAWLWASDEVLMALHHFLELQIQHASPSGPIDQASMQDAYAKLIIAMRRDAGFANTHLSPADYQFVNF